MPWPIDTHPVRAQWAATLFVVIGMAVLMPCVQPQPFAKNIPAILGAGVGMYVAMGILRRRRARRRDPEATNTSRS